MPPPDGRAATYDDLRASPESVHVEIIDGHIVTAEAPLPRHSKSQSALSHFIGGPFDHEDGFGGLDSRSEARTLEALTLEAGRWIDAGSFDETASVRVDCPAGDRVRGATSLD